MNRSEFKRIFTAQGSTPLDSVKASGGSIRVEYDRVLRANALSMNGDVSQCKVQLPKDDRSRLPLGTSSWLALIAFFGNADFSLDVDVTATLSVVPLSANGSAVSSPVSRRVTQRVSIATFHDASASSRCDPKGPCRVALTIPRGQWGVVAVDLAHYLCQFYTVVCAAEANQSGPSPSLARGKALGPPNLFSKTPRVGVTALSTSIDRLVLGGSVKLKEVLCMSDMLVAETMGRDLRLPVFVLPQLEGFLEPSVASRQSGWHEGVETSQTSPLRSVPVVVPQSPQRSVQAQQQPQGVFQVRFTRDADGKVALAAKDLEQERRLREEAEALEIQKEMERNRQQLQEVMAREEAANNYRRFVEPEAKGVTDRFGVRAADKSAQQAQASRVDPQVADGGLTAWGDGSSLAAQSPAPKKSTTVKNSGVQEARPSRISYLPVRKPIFCSKVGEHVDTAPLPPAPSSLLLTSVMKRPLAPTYPADDVRMVRTPPAGGPGAVLVNGVCTGRVLGYGVGCMDVIHFGTESDETTDADDESLDDTDEDTADTEASDDEA